MKNTLTASALGRNVSGWSIASRLVEVDSVADRAESAGDSELARLLRRHAELVRNVPGCGIGEATLQRADGSQILVSRAASYIRRGGVRPKSQGRGKRGRLTDPGVVVHSRNTGKGGSSLLRSIEAARTRIKAIGGSITQAQQLAEINALVRSADGFEFLQKKRAQRSDDLDDDDEDDWYCHPEYNIYDPTTWPE